MWESFFVRGLEMLHPRYFLNHSSNTFKYILYTRCIESTYSLELALYSHQPVKVGWPAGLCIFYVFSINGINVFLRGSSAAWYRLAKYIMTQEWGWSTRGPLVSRCIINVFCLYLDLASTACMEVWWYMDHTWIMYGSHNTPKLVGYVWDTS